MIYIVTINYNNSTDTIECLKSLEAVKTEYRVFVVDNASNSDDYERLKRFVEELPDGICVGNGRDNSLFEGDTRVVLIREDANLGFSGGNNRAISIARRRNDFEAVVLLNNDTVVHPDFLSEMIRFSSSHPAADLMGGRIFLYKPDDVLWYDGGKYNPHIGKAIHLHINQRISDVQSVNTPHETGFITGCLLFISKRCLDTVGLLDEEMFMYGEDLDYCIRAQKCGLKLFQVPSSVIWHKFSASSGGEFSTFSGYWIIRNRFWVARKHASFPDRSLTLLYFLISRIPRFVKWNVQGHKGVVNAQLKGMLDGLKKHN